MGERVVVSLRNGFPMEEWGASGVDGEEQEEGERERETYGVARGKFLLGGDGVTRTASGVQSSLPTDDRLARGSAAAVDVLANLDSIGIPRRHLDGIGFVWFGDVWLR